MIFGVVLLIALIPAALFVIYRDLSGVRRKSDAPSHRRRSNADELTHNGAHSGNWSEPDTEDIAPRFATTTTSPYRGLGRDITEKFKLHLSSDSPDKVSAGSREKWTVIVPRTDLLFRHHHGHNYVLTPYAAPPGQPQDRTAIDIDHLAQRSINWRANVFVYDAAASSTKRQSYRPTEASTPETSPVSPLPDRSKYN